jgi:hypothetical protein
MEHIKSLYFISEVSKNKYATLKTRTAGAISGQCLKFHVDVMTSAYGIHLEQNSTRHINNLPVLSSTFYIIWTGGRLITVLFHLLAVLNWLS